jgi:hypothetical protein
MGSQMTPKSPLTPVVTDLGCLGHVRATAKGFVAYDRDDRPIGTFADASSAIAAVLST